MKSGEFEWHRPHIHTHNTHTHTQNENPVPMTHRSHPLIPQMKMYLDATATAAFSQTRPDQTEILLRPVSQVRSNIT